MKRPYTHTLDHELMDQVAARAAATRTSKSALVEQGLRLVLGLPVPEEEQEEPGLAPTRSEIAVLSVVRDLGSGWHDTVEIGKAAGLSRYLTLKALKALERRGDVFRWGWGQQCISGNHIETWGAQDPKVVIPPLCARLKAMPDGQAFLSPLFGVLQSLVWGLGESSLWVRELLAPLPMPAPERPFSVEDLEGDIWTSVEDIKQRMAIERKRAAAHAAGR